MSDRKQFGFSKNERLSKKKLIDQLFQDGNFFIHYPFRIVWMLNTDENPYPSQIGISVSKRFIKEAVRRNFIKRMIRESFRKNKNELYKYLSDRSKRIVFMIIYLEKKPVEYMIIESKIKETLLKLRLEIDSYLIKQV